MHVYIHVDSCCARVGAGMLTMPNAHHTHRHTFVSGMLAGYIVMGRDGSDFGLKKNVNMYIAIRTLWSVANYSARTKLLPWLVRAPANLN